MEHDGICDVCGNEGKTLVSALPGIPMSVARCIPCLEADAIPYGVLVAQTACLGGLEHAVDWWKETVTATLAHLNIPREQYDQAVQECLVAERKYWEAQPAEALPTAAETSGDPWA